jgi:mRNA interferase RelE/StbE
MYELIYSRKSLQKLKKLSPELRERMIKTLERCRIRPTSFAKKLVGRPEFSLRVGKYRILLDISREKLIVLVLSVDHRGKIHD